MCKKNQCNLKMAFPQFSLWVFALPSRAPLLRALPLVPRIGSQPPPPSDVQGGVQAHVAWPPHTNRRKWKGLRFNQPLDWLGFLTDWEGGTGNRKS